MKKDEIHLQDIKRILFGDVPPTFLLETFVRTLVIYVALLLIVRWLGKRMSGALTIMEMAVMLTLGAIVSVSMQVPDRGLLQGILLLLCTVLFQRGISMVGFRSGKFEDIVQGKTSLLIKDGILQLDQMKKDRFSRQQLFAELRQENILHLGMVDRVYLGAESLFSIFEAEEPRPGLPILPPEDTDILEKQQLARPTSPRSMPLLACVGCGTIPHLVGADACAACGHQDFVNAII